MKAQRLWTILLLAAAAAVFLAHARFYWDWTEDDAFISFRYAHNLAAGNGLVFNPGERVEGYSNFSWVLVAAAALRRGADPVQVSKIVGIACGVLSMLLAWALARRMRPEAGLRAAIAAFYIALSPVLVQHAIAGLETSLFAGLAAAAVWLAWGRAGRLQRAALVVVLLLLSLTRPEGAAVALLILGMRAWLAARGGETPEDAPARRAALVDLGAFVVLFGIWFAWRWAYFGAPFPNTFYAKARGGLHGVIDGGQYTLDFLRDAGGPFFVALGLVPLALAPRRPAYLVALGAAVGYVGFVLASGGDWMFHYRFYAHVLPIVAALVVVGLDTVLALPRAGTLRGVLVYGIATLALLATFLGMGNTELRVARMVLPALERGTYLSQNYAQLGRWFRDNTPPATTIAISDVGAVGYFSERHIIDMFGLIDPHIARLHGRMHYKADPRYVLERRPDYIVLVSLNDEGEGYSFQRVPDYAMHALPEFHQRYELIRTVPQYWQNEFVLVYRRR